MSFTSGTRSGAVLMGLAALASVLVGCGAEGAESSGQGGSPRIIAVTHGQAADPYWAVVKNGMESAAEELNVTLEYRAPEKFDIVEMRRLIEVAGAQDPDGLIVTLPDPDALATVVRKVADSGIPVIAFGTGQSAADDAGARIFIGQDEELAGREAGRRMRKQGVDKAVCLNPEVGNVALDERCRGFEEALGSPVQVVPVSLDPTVVEKRLAATLQKDSSIEGVLATAAPTAEAALEAVEGTDAKLAAIDISPGVLEAVRDGEMLFTIDDQAFLQGYEAVAQMSLFSRYQLMIPHDIITGPTVVGPDQAPEILELAQKKYH